MKVIIFRHGEVAFRWNAEYSSAEFDAACSAYDKAPLKDAEHRAPETECRHIYISNLPRTRETALKLFPDGELTETALIDEVPLRSSFNTAKKKTLRFWFVSGRLQWALNARRQPEGRRQTRQRAREFARMLCREGADCIVITHGFFMNTLLKEMQKAGFTVADHGQAFQNGEYVTAER